MLSPQTSAMDQQQRQPRRQNSAPIQLEASTLPQLPTTYPTASHFQMVPSLAHHMVPMQQFAGAEDGKVGITNTGHNTQHYLQVTQQHGQAGPGQQQHDHIHPSSLQLSAHEYREMQHRRLDAQLDTLIQTSTFPPEPPSNAFASIPSNSMHFVKIERTRSNPEGFYGVNTTGINPQNVMMSPASGHLMYFDNTPDCNSRRPSASSDAATMPWIAPTLQPNWNFQMQAPLTPPTQSSSDYFPFTPAHTPCQPTLDLRQHQFLKHETNSTIKAPRPLRHVRSLASIQESEPSAAGESDLTAIVRPLKRRLSMTGAFSRATPELLPVALPSPPQTAPLKSSRTFDAAMFGGPALGEIPKLSFLVPDEILPARGQSMSVSPRLRPIPESPSVSSAPTINVMTLPIRSVEGQRSTSPMSEDREETEYGAWDALMHAPLSPRTMAMTDLGLDAIIEDTGITAEEVHAYISEPDPATGKWTCMFPECGRLFSRKENIRSHVQTHLGDRQFKCAHCSKRFVRQHDLKRHAKIHSGVKPFPCRCGNSFARHDALTRHRQRGICDGGFAGIVKKIAKRGRPKKERASAEDRADRASRSRKRTTDKSYASSEAGTSESSAPDSPYEEMMETADTPTNTDCALAGIDAAFSFPPVVFSYTPPVSPHSTGFAPSPSKEASVEPALTPSSLALDDHEDRASTINGADLLLTTTLAIPAPFSHAGSPPPLSHSSPSTGHLYSLDLFNSSELGQSTNEADFDMLADQFTHTDSLAHFDASWEDSPYAGFDKDSDSLTMNAFGQNDFDDQSLF